MRLANHDLFANGLPNIAPFIHFGENWRSNPTVRRRIICAWKHSWSAFNGDRLRVKLGNTYTTVEGGLVVW